MREIRKSWNGTKVALLTKLAVFLCRFLSRVSDAMLLLILLLVRKVVSEPEQSAGLDELISIVKTGPPGTLILKRMLSESRPDEIHEMIFGQVRLKETDLSEL